MGAKFMALVNAKCTNCNKKILLDDTKDASVCPNCNEAFVTEKAIKLYNYNPEKEKQIRHLKRRNRWKTVGRAILLVLECIVDIIAAILVVGFFVDVFDSKKK